MCEYTATDICWQPSSHDLGTRIVNVLADLARLIHGPKDTLGCGRPCVSIPTCWACAAAEALRKRFQVNEWFGDHRGKQHEFLLPFQLRFRRCIRGNGAGAADDNRGAGAARGGAGGAGGRGGRLGSSEMRGRMLRSANAYRQVVEQNDSVGLGLTAVQKARLETLADSLDTANRVIADRI